MNQNISTEWTKTERIIFRLAFCYLLFYFLFLDNFFIDLFPFLNYVHAPFQSISNNFIGFVNRLFIHNEYDKNIYKGFGDTSWSCIAILSYSILAVLATVVWTVFDKRKNNLRLFTLLQTYARYYLAFILFFYGFGKLFGVQFFDPSPDYLMQPLGNIDSHTLLWTFMANSKSYNFFGGLMEVVPGALLLFRRTTTLGVLIAIATLINVLMLDIGYDTLVKIYAAHFVLISLFILSPDVKRVYNFFSNKNTSLAVVPTVIPQQRLKWVQYSLKFILIAFIVFDTVNVSVRLKENYSRSYFGGIDGIYEIKDFYLNRQLLPPLDTLRWKKIGINKFGQMALQYVNDSVSYYGMNVDTAAKSLTLSSWNDSTFKSHLHFTIANPEEYVFEGIYKNDSIRFNSRKIDLQNYPLLKDKGNVKWVWW